MKQATLYSTMQLTS